MSRNNIKLGLKSLCVKYENRGVGTLALDKNKKVAFSYDEGWLADGFSISPFSLPLEEKVFIPEQYHYDGLFGIFADSLPDAWGRLLLSRVLKEHHIEQEITVLDRLALVGENGMGALTYEPDYELVTTESINDLDYLSEQCRQVLQTAYAEDLDALYEMAGSSGGARPKILTHLEGKDWMIKFPAHVDRNDIGKLEYDYSLCAKKCGIDMMETKLFPSKECKGYFGTVLFDRDEKKNRIHMATAAALLEADFNAPCMDYHTLMKLTRILTGEKKQDIENMFRRMCFNVFAHNRDDHAKNFTFLYHKETDRWGLSPAYDLTYSNTYFGEHTTSVDGNGANPGEKELMNVGIKAGMKQKECSEILHFIKSTVAHDLREYL